jgi:hypothetical protein
MINRRSLITGFVSFVAAPTIVRATSLMPINAGLAPAISFDEFNRQIMDSICRSYGIPYHFVRRFPMASRTTTSSDNSR